MTKTKDLALARLHCANYSDKKCMGIDLQVRPQKGKIVPVEQIIDIDKVDKNCADLIEECSYFSTIVERHHK